MSVDVSLHKDMPRQILTALHAMAHGWAIGFLAIIIFTPRAQVMAAVTFPQLALGVIGSLIGVATGFWISQSSRIRQVLSGVHPVTFLITAMVGFMLCALAYTEGLVDLWPITLWLLPACLLDALRLFFSQRRRQGAG